MNSNILTNRKYKQREMRHLVLNLIRKKGSISRIEIAKRTRIRPGTLQGIIEELLREKIIREKGLGDSKGGRRPILLELNPDTRWIVALHVDEVWIKAGLVNLKGEVLSQIKEDNSIHQSQKEFIECIMDSIEGLLSPKDKQKVMGIGIGIPGLVDREKGIGIYCSYYDWWRNIPIKSLLENRFKIPVYVENDTIAATLGEKWFGAGRGVKNFLYLNLGETIGMGIVIEGHLYYGAGGSAGELGHTIIKEGGPLCICGNRGCLEAIASGMAIKKEIQKLLNEGVKSIIADELERGKRITLRMITEAVLRGDKVASKLVCDTGVHLGVGISNVVNLLNPELIILGGTLVGARKILTETIVNSIRTHCLPKPSSEVRVEVSKLGDNAGVLGASTLITRKFFEVS